MCIRPISNNGSVSVKKKSRELTNLLRSMEKEMEAEEAQVAKGQFLNEDNLVEC